MSEQSKDYFNGHREGAKEAAERIKSTLTGDINKGIELRNLEINKMRYEIEVLVDMRANIVAA